MGEDQAALAVDPQRVTIHPWWLTFRPHAFERQFLKSWLKATGRTNKIWLMSGVGFYCLFTALLFVFLPEKCHDFLWVRYSITIPILIVSQIPVYFYKNPIRYFGVLYFIGALSGHATALFLFSYTHLDHNIIYLFELAAVYVFCQQYTRTLFKFSLLFSILSGSSTIIVMALEPQLIGVPIVPTAAAIVAIALVGIFASYTREFFLRRNYLSMQALKGESQRNTDLAEEAMAANEAKSRFLAIVSHEFRTPLNAIIGYADALKAGIFGPITNPKIRSAHDDISISGHHLLGIVNDVLDLSKATMGTIELNEETFDVIDLLAELKRAFEPECKTRGGNLYLACDTEPVLLLADRRLVRQMISNLIANSLKYTKGEAEIWIYTVRLDRGGLAITVKDNGAGISPQQIDKALLMFEQVDDDLDRRYDGLGIGLPLTKRLIELHGGAIAIESKPGGGTSVELRFPSNRVIETNGPRAASTSRVADGRSGVT